MESTRTGPDNWRDAPNGSRIDKEVKSLLKRRTLSYKIYC